jgi:8-hydroxy-5-deazaflavin:NADPH oxidoreductase
MRRPSRGLLRGMKIAVIGKGNIGGSLGSKWRAAGYDVVYGARDASDAVNRIGAPEFDSRALIAGAVPSARYVRAFNTLGWENFASPLPGTDLFYAAAPEARPVAEELIAAVGLEPAFVGGPDVTSTVDALLPLWFALVKQNGGNRRVALRIIREE